MSRRRVRNMITNNNNNRREQAMNAIETSYYEEAIAAGACHEDAMEAAETGGYLATCQTKIVHTTEHEGHEIRYTSGFDGKSMKFRWIDIDQQGHVLVSEHDTLEEAKATIDQFVEGEVTPRTMRRTVMSKVWA